MAIFNPKKSTSLKVIYDKIDEFAANGLAKVMLIVSKVERVGFINKSGKPLSLLFMKVFAYTIQMVLPKSK